jgi:hypothetical protein
MKKCPQCGREYDASMMFCLDDGAELLYGPASGKSEPSPSGDGRFGDEPQTAILHDTASRAEGDTRAQVTFTNPTAVLPSVDVPAKARSKVPLVIAAVILVLSLCSLAWHLFPRKPSRPGLNMQVSKLVSGLKGIPGDVRI